MPHSPLPIHLIPTRGLVSDTLATSGTITRDTSPEFIVSGGYLSASASDLPEELGGEHAPYFRGVELSTIKIIPGTVDYSGYGSPATSEPSVKVSSEGTAVIRPISPKHLRDQLSLIRKTDRIARFDGAVNCFTHRRGRDPSNGFFLVLKSDITEGLMQSFKTQVTFEQAKNVEASTNSKDFNSQVIEANNTVTIKELFLVQAVAVTPVITGPEFDDSELSAESDVENQVYVIELADRRALTKFGSYVFTEEDDTEFFDAVSYNIRPPADNPQGNVVGGSNNEASYGLRDDGTDPEIYYVASMDSVSDPGDVVAWTWTTMIQDMWDRAFPSTSDSEDPDPLDLSYADFPTHNPEGYTSSTSKSSYDFFFDTIDGIFHTLVRKLDGTWLLVAPGNLNSPSDSPRDMMRVARHHLQDCLNPIATKWNRLPQKVTVTFPKNVGKNTTTTPNMLTPLDNYAIGKSLSLDFVLDLNNEAPPSTDVEYSNSYSQFTGASTYTGGMGVGDTAIAGGTPALHRTHFVIQDRLRARYGFERPANPAVGGSILSDEFVNYSDLSTRAQELTTLYRDFIIQTDPLLYRKYNGYWKFEGTHKVKEITWGDTGEGPYTCLNNPTRKREEISEMAKSPKPPEQAPINRMAWARLFNPQDPSNFDELEPGQKAKAALLSLTPSSSTGLLTQELNSRLVNLHNVHHERSILRNELALAMWDAEVQQWTAVSSGGATHHATEMTTVKAQEDWQYGAGITPYTRFAWVSVKKCDSAGQVWGDAFDVYLTPTSPSQIVQTYGNFDANVVSGQIFLAALIDAAGWIAVSGHLDAKIGTVRIGATGNFGSQGWGQMDGTANSSGNGGSGIDMRDYLIKGTVQDLSIGDTDGTLTPSSTTGETTPDSITSGSTTVNVFSDDDNTSGTDGTGSNNALTDYTNFSSTSHTHSIPGSAHSHTIDRPATTKLIFYERLNNGVDNS